MIGNAQAFHTIAIYFSHAFIVLAPSSVCGYRRWSLRICAHSNAVLRAFTSRGECGYFSIGFGSLLQLHEKKKDVHSIFATIFACMEPQAHTLTQAHQPSCQCMANIQARISSEAPTQQQFTAEHGEQHRRNTHTTAQNTSCTHTNEMLAGNRPPLQTRSIFTSSRNVTHIELRVASTICSDLSLSSTRLGKVYTIYRWCVITPNYKKEKNHNKNSSIGREKKKFRREGRPTRSD